MNWAWNQVQLHTESVSNYYTESKIQLLLRTMYSSTISLEAIILSKTTLGAIRVVASA